MSNQQKGGWKKSIIGMQKTVASTRKITQRIIFGLIMVVVAVAVLIFGIMFLIEQFVHLTQNSTLYFWVFSAVALGVGIIVGTILSVLYSRMVKKMTQPYIDALQRVSDGDYTTRIDKDNLFLQDTHLAENFNNMVRRLASVETLSENFISDFSHEFKTPIVSIVGFAKLLKDANLTEEERNEYLDVIINESERLVHLSQSVLALTRLDGQIVEKEEFLLDEQIRQSVLLLDKRLQEKDIQLDLNLETITVNSSQKLLSQVWVNLIDNAIKFSNYGGKIVVSGSCNDAVATVTVTDFGCGMDEETRQNVFNKFFQGDKSRSVEGNGLGLAIVHKILKLVDGAIEVQSKLGEGSTFIVTIPTE